MIQVCTSISTAYFDYSSELFLLLHAWFHIEYGVLALETLTTILHFVHIKVLETANHRWASLIEDGSIWIKI